MAAAAANFFSSAVDKLFESVGHVFGVDGFKPLQKLCLASLLKGQDVLACLPTGYFSQRNRFPSVLFRCSTRSMWIPPPFLGWLLV